MNELQEKHNSLVATANAILAKAEHENRDLSAEDVEQLNRLKAEVADVGKQIEKRAADDAFRKEISSWGVPAQAGQSQEERGVIAPEKGKTLGQQFVETRAYKDLLTRFGGQLPQSPNGVRTDPVFFKTLVTGEDPTSAGAFVLPDYTGIYEPLGRMELSLRNLITIRQTTSDLLYFVRQTAQITQAAAVQESNVTDYTGATGQISGEKPEAAIEFEIVDTHVKEIAAWIPVTTRALADAPQIRGIIDGELRDDMAEELENQMLNGTGVGANFTGLLNTAGILVQLWVTDVFTTCRQAITTLRTTGRSIPTAWLMHPSDWETIDLLRDNNGQFYWGGPLRQGPPTLWGYPVVQSELLTQGTAILGDWRKAVLWDRQRSSLDISDSHVDFFIRNMVAIRAVLRAAFGLIRPSAFITVDLTSGS